MCAVTIFTRAAVSSLLLASTMIASTSRAGELPAGQESAQVADALLRSGDKAEAIVAAETAVARSPAMAPYRTLLGRAYLLSGRYRSAETVFVEALTIDTSDGRAAGGLVLSQLALGRPGAARASLGDYGRIIAPTDLGLLVALAGDPVTGAVLLESTARQGGPTPKLRQNLALAYALAGRWPEARSLAAVDLGDQAAHARMLTWSSYAGGNIVAAHIAALVGPTADQDPGRPIALALNAAPVQVAAQTETPQPLSLQADAPAPIQFAGFRGVQFAPRREIVQALPADYRPAMLASRPAPSRPPARLAATSMNSLVMQIGAFDSPGLALQGWRTAERRLPELARWAATGTTFSRGDRTLYRVAVQGFADRGEAVSLCERFRRVGGSCFVRQSAGDRPLEQAFAPTRLRLAAR